MTYTGAIICRKTVNPTCLEEIWIKAERFNNAIWKYVRTGPYMPVGCTPTTDPCVRWAIYSTRSSDDVRAGRTRKKFHADPEHLPQGVDFERMSKDADTRAGNFFRKHMRPYRVFIDCPECRKSQRAVALVCTGCGCAMDWLSYVPTCEAAMQAVPGASDADVKAAMAANA